MPRVILFGNTSADELEEVKVSLDRIFNADYHYRIKGNGQTIFEER